MQSAKTETFFQTFFIPPILGLQYHRQRVHRDSGSAANDMVIPVINLRNQASLQALSRLGVNNLVPLNALQSPDGGSNFAIPLIKVVDALRLGGAQMAGLGAV